MENDLKQSKIFIVCTSDIKPKVHFNIWISVVSAQNPSVLSEFFERKIVRQLENTMVSSELLNNVIYRGFDDLELN